MWNRSRIQFFALNANFGQKSWNFIPGSLNIPYFTDSRLYLKTDNGGFRRLKNGLQGDMFIIDRGHPAIVGLSVCRMDFRPDYLSGVRFRPRNFKTVGDCFLTIEDVKFR